jgi:hypothetical protein
MRVFVTYDLIEIGTLLSLNGCVKGNTSRVAIATADVFICAAPVFAMDMTCDEPSLATIDADMGAMTDITKKDAAMRNELVKTALKDNKAADCVMHMNNAADFRRINPISSIVLQRAKTGNPRGSRRRRARLPLDHIALELSRLRKKLEGS